ncbi:MAG: hypothetical protein AAGE52_01555 [Myxococcota bacterium]
MKTLALAALFTVTHVVLGFAIASGIQREAWFLAACAALSSFFVSALGIQAGKINATVEALDALTGSFRSGDDE